MTIDPSILAMIEDVTPARKRKEFTPEEDEVLIACHNAVASNVTMVRILQAAHGTGTRATVYRRIDELKAEGRI